MYEYIQKGNFENMISQDEKQNQNLNSWVRQWHGGEGAQKQNIPALTLLHELELLPVLIKKQMSEHECIWYGFWFQDVGGLWSSGILTVFFLLFLHYFSNFRYIWGSKSAKCLLNKSTLIFSNLERKENLSVLIHSHGLRRQASVYSQGRKEEKAGEKEIQIKSWYITSKTIPGLFIGQLQRASFVVNILWTWWPNMRLTVNRIAHMGVGQ